MHYAKEYCFKGTKDEPAVGDETAGTAYVWEKSKTMIDSGDFDTEERKDQSRNEELEQKNSQEKLKPQATMIMKSKPAGKMRTSKVGMKGKKKHKDINI